jgi:hypothetical protein
MFVRTIVRLFMLTTTLTLHRRAPGGSAVLTRRRQEFDEIHTRTRGVIDAAAGAENGAGRELTEAELAAVTADRERAETLAREIQELVDDELRAARVAAGYADIGAPAGTEGAGGQEGDGGDEQHRSGDGAGGGQYRTQDRDPGHYRSVAEGGQHSFFADIVHAREGDTDAVTRLQEHNRAGTMAVSGAGIVPPRWLTDEYETIARQGRVLAEMVRHIPITDAAPMTLPKQTAGTDGVVAEQATENTHPSETDAFATHFDTVNPKPTSGIQVVSRQMIDSTNPAVDSLIYGDMLSVYNTKVENKVSLALIAAAGAATATVANEAGFTAAAAEDAITDAAIAVWNGRKLPADVCAMRTSRWGRFMKFRDSGGRRLYPAEGEMVNISGRGSVKVPGTVGGLGVAVTDGLGIGAATYPENILVFRSADTILFEGSMLRFRYEEVAGPESVKLGIWAYTAVIVRQAALSVRRVQITAAV